MIFILYLKNFHTWIILPILAVDFQHFSKKTTRGPFLHEQENVSDFLTLKAPEKLQLYVYYVVHICDLGMLRVNIGYLLIVFMGIGMCVCVCVSGRGGVGPFLHFSWLKTKELRRLNEKTGNCTLILYKTNGQRAVFNVYTYPFYCPPETLIWRQFCGWSQCCLFCFFVNSQSHPYKSMNKPNLGWLRVMRVISYRCTITGEVMCALCCPIVR